MLPRRIYSCLHLSGLSLCPAAIIFAGLLHAQPIQDRPQVNVTEIDTMPNWQHVFADPCWQEDNAKSVTLQAPLNVTFPKSPESTRIRLRWDTDFLLIRFDCRDESIVRLPSSYGLAGKRDLPYFEADAVEAFIDPVGDARAYMEFEFGVNGGVFDAIYLSTANPHSGADYILDGSFVDRDLFIVKEWNLDGLQTTTRIWPPSEGHGWSVVAAFPAKEMLKRLGESHFMPGMKFKANFVRFNYFLDSQRLPEITNWARVLAGCAHVSPTGMGTLTLGPPN